MPASYPLTRSIVRALRIKHGMTQEILAAKAGVDYKYYQRFELGGTPAPSLATLEEIGRVFRLDPWVLICSEKTLMLKRTGLSAEELAAASHRSAGRPKKKDSRTP